FALLLDPRVVLLVVPALPVELRAFLYPLVNGGFAEDVQPASGFVLRHLAGGRVQAFHHRRIPVEPVGGDGDYVLAFAGLDGFGGLDRAEDVADGTDAERVHKLPGDVGRDAFGDEHVRAFLQKLEAFEALQIVDTDE